MCEQATTGSTFGGTQQNVLLLSNRTCGIISMAIPYEGLHMTAAKSDVPQGTLALMVLTTLQTMGPLHGYGIARRIEQTSGNRLAVNYGTLYPALLKLQQEGYISSEWGVSANNRKAKYYKLTRAGHKQVEKEVGEMGTDQCDSGPVPGSRSGNSMRTLRAWFLRAAGLFHNERRDRELADEIESSLRMHIDDNLRAGMTPAEAQRQAMLKFGSVESAKESYRDQRGIPLLETLWQDVRFGLRMLRKSASFTALAVLTLALGVGTNATVFSWVRTLLLNPLPGVVAANHVVALETLTPDGSWEPTSYLDFRDLRDHCKLVQAMSVTKPMALAVGDRESVERVWGEAVSGNFFEMLGVKPALGRFFSTAEVDQQQNAHPLVIISHPYWVSHYHADPGVIGASVRINHFPYTVIGVTPEEFHGSMPGLSFDAWVPATMYGQLASTGDNTLLDRKWRTFRVLARLALGVSLGEARDEVESHAKDMARDDASTNEGMSATLLPMWESHYGIQGSMLGPLGILMTACALVLLIVCANLANLQLARATARQKEFVLRLSLGATRSRLIRQVSSPSARSLLSPARLVASQSLRGSRELWDGFCLVFLCRHWATCLWTSACCFLRLL